MNFTWIALCLTMCTCDKKKQEQWRQHCGQVASVRASRRKRIPATPVVLHTVPHHPPSTVQLKHALKPGRSDKEGQTLQALLWGCTYGCMHGCTTSMGRRQHNNLTKLDQCPKNKTPAKASSFLLRLSQCKHGCHTMTFLGRAFQSATLQVHHDRPGRGVSIAFIRGSVCAGAYA